MAVIQKIRERYAKLAGFVIGLALVAFIISEGINGSFGSLFGKDMSVAKVDGNGIDGKEYYDAVQEYQSLTELFRRGQPVKDEELAQLRQGVLDQLVMEKLVEKEAKKLGVVVGEQEEKDMFYGPNPDPTVQQFPYFAGENGAFDPQNVKNFEREVKKAGTEEAMRAAAQWTALKKFLIRQKLVQKYNMLVGNSAYTPKYMLALNAKDGANMANIRFVKIPFTSVDDATTPVSDQDITNYMNKHKAQYLVTQPTRSIDYVVYEVTPDADDTAKAINALNKIRADFGTTADNEKFVNRNSDAQYVDAYVTKQTYMSPFSDSIFSQPVGSVYGPYFNNGSYNLTKVVAKTTLPDSVKCRHILIKTEDQGKPVIDSAIAKARIDSIATAIAGGADFKEMAARYTDDEGSKATGGEYDFTLQQRAGISKEFGDFIFEGRAGEKKVVRVANGAYAGYHLIEILGQKDMVNAYKLADISKSLITSSRSSNTILAKANKFAGTNANAKAFEETVKKEGLNMRVAEDIKAGDFTIQGLGSARDLVQWAYNAKEGAVSDPIQLENRYVVAKLSAIQEPGLRKLNTNMRAQIEGIVRAEKKGKQIADKYKSMQSLDAIGQAATQPVQSADSIKGNASFAPAIGYEPKVVGYAFNESFKPNTLSPALIGKDGVFFITVTGRTQGTVSEADKAMQEQQAQMESAQTKNYLNSMLVEALKKNSEITYNAKNIR